MCAIYSNARRLRNVSKRRTMERGTLGKRRLEDIRQAIRSLIIHKFGRELIHSSNLHSPPPFPLIALVHDVEDTSTFRDFSVRVKHEVFHRDVPLDRATYFELLTQIANDAFDDEVVNWGRIGTLVAFACVAASECCQDRMGGFSVDDVVEWISHYLHRNLGDWMETKGGWVSLEVTSQNIARVA